MEYCFGSGDGSATMWVGAPDFDLDGDGILDAVRLDFDGDGLLDDVMGDLDGDGLADHAALDIDDDGTAESFFADDGSGTWAVTVDRSGQIRWFGVDGVEHFGGQEGSDPGINGGGPVVDFDSDGQADDRVIDGDGNGLADRAVCAGPSGAIGYLDVDGDGRWDIELADADGDGAADTVTEL